MGPRSRELLAAAVGRGPVQRRLPVRHLARAGDRLCPRPGEPDHLCRRAGLGALRPGRVRDPRVRPDRRGRPGVRPDPRRLPRHERLPHREGLPPLGPRHRPRGRPARRRPRLLRRLGQAGRVHRPRGAAARPRGRHARRAAWSSSACWTTAKLLYHEEPVWADGRIVGSVTSGMYGHRVGAPLGMGYLQPRGGVTQAWLDGLELEVEVAWERVPAKAQLAAVVRSEERAHSAVNARSPARTGIRNLPDKSHCDIVCDVRLVLDTDVVVAALRSPSGGSAALLRAIRLGHGKLLISPTLLFEYEAVCQLADHRLAAGLSMQECRSHSRCSGAAGRAGGDLLSLAAAVARPRGRDGPGGRGQWSGAMRS